MKSSWTRDERNPSGAAHGRPKAQGVSLGYLYIALAAVLWGISASLGRAAFTEQLLPGSGIRNVSPVILSQARTTFSFLAVCSGAAGGDYSCPSMICCE